MQGRINQTTQTLLNKSRIDPAAGKLFSTAEEAKEFMKGFLGVNPGFEPRPQGYIKFLGGKKQKKNVFAFVSVQKREKGQWAWVFRFTVKGQKNIQRELNIKSLNNMPPIQECFQKLAKKYAPGLIT